MHPGLALEDVETTDHGDGLYTVELALVNTGVLPTCPQFAADARIARPIRVRLQLPPGVERLNGPAQVLVDRLDGGGGRREFRWLIGGANAGTSLTLSADADTVPSLSEEIVLP